MSIKKVCFITGTRAESGLLFWVMKGIQNDPFFKFQLIVTGMHLSPEFGMTYKEIETDFIIDKKIEILLSSDTPIGISKSMGLAQISFAEAYEELKPDLIVVLGDRFEIFSAVSAAMIARVPVAHIDGGETTEGAFDEAIRHSISKMSHLHFTSAEKYRQRVIQLGEQPERVYNVGALGIENIKKLKLLTKHEFEKSINFKLNKKNILVTFHPVTLEDLTSKIQFQELLNTIDGLEKTHIIFTKANSDTSGRVINQMIDDYVTKNRHKSICFVSMGQLRYLSAMQYVDAVVGNSSSGIVEAPSFNTPTVNIGDRQKGRIMGVSIFSCQPRSCDINLAIHKALKFDKSIKYKSPYGDGKTSQKILDVLKKIENISIKKIFFDIKKIKI